MSAMTNPDFHDAYLDVALDASDNPLPGEVKVVHDPHGVDPVILDVDKVELEQRGTQTFIYIYYQ